MQQFIPFEDDWDALEKLCPEALIPYRVGLVPVHEPAAAHAGCVSVSPLKPAHSSPSAAMSFEKTA
jgi:hypothetical protein